MNRKLIQKIIDELSKDQPKLDYVRGILETVLESLPEEKVIWNPEKENLVVSNRLKGELDKPIDEAQVLEAGTRAKMKTINFNAIQQE